MNGAQLGAAVKRRILPELGPGELTVDWAETWSPELRKEVRDWIEESGMPLKRIFRIQFGEGYVTTEEYDLDDFGQPYWSVEGDRAQTVHVCRKPSIPPMPNVQRAVVDIHRIGASSA